MMRIAVTAFLAIIVPVLVAGFSLPGTVAAPRRTMLFYHDEVSPAACEDETTARAKKCIEHFGECSIEELEELQESLSQDCFSLANHNLQSSRRLEHDLNHQLELLKQHQGTFFITDAEPPLVERVRECVEDFGECSLAELEHLQTNFHKMAESTPTLFEEDPSEEAWLEDGLSLQVRLLKDLKENEDNNRHYNTEKSLYPESRLLNRARFCTEEFGECSLDELEELYTKLDHMDKDEGDDDVSEKTWLQDGLALQLKIRETDLGKPKKTTTHKRKHRREQTAEASTLYPEVPIVDEARACAENFGTCSLEELQSVQHRLEEMVKVFESFDGMQLFEDESEQAWIQDGLALQIKLLKEQGADQPDVATQNTETEEVYFLYPEISAIDRARDCADEFGKCSIEEMQDLIPTLEHYRELAAAHEGYVDETDSAWVEEDELQWLEDGLELQISLREKSRRAIKYDHLT